MCHAGFAANHLEALLRGDTEDRATPAIQLGVLASSLPLERSYDGLFAAALLAALAEGSPNNHWRDTTEQISLLELCSELRDRLGEQTAFTAGRDGIKIPNPRYRPGTAERPVLLGDLLASLPVEDREHFLDKASGSDARDIGWYFSGRRAATRQVLQWLHDHPEGGVCVVTGAPGAGKSAFLGRLAVLADPGSQNACRALGMLDDPAELLPTPGLFDAVVHARELDTARVAIEIGAQLGIDVAFANRPEVALRAALVESGRAVTVLIDAIDEVTRGNEDGVTLAIIRALASLPGCRVVVGTRRDRA